MLPVPAARFRRSVPLAGLALALSSLLTIAGPVQGQQLPPVGGDDVADGGPVLSLAAEEIDYGVISDLRTVTRKMSFTNTGDGLLTISEIKGSCGCTVPELSIRDYLPGESGVMEVRYDPAGRAGKQRKSVTIYSNDARNQVQRFAVVVDVEPAVMLEPKNIALGQVVHRTPASRTFDIVSARDEFELDAIEFEGAHVSAEVLERTETELPDGRTEHRVTVEVEIDGDAPLGWFSRPLRVRTRITSEDDPEEMMEHTVNSTLSATIVGDLQASPSRIPFGTPEPGTLVKRNLRIASLTDTPFEILGYSIETENDIRLDIELSEETSPAGQKYYQMNVTGAMPGKPGPFRGFVVLETDRENQAEIKLPFFGTARARPNPGNRGRGSGGGDD